MHGVIEPASRPYAVDDLRAMPDDGRRRELMLAVEVESPSTSLSDRNLKRAHYQRLGVASYWMLRPTEPGALEVLELDGGGCYRSVASARGDEEVAVSRPFPVSLCPARLLDGLRPRS